MSIYIFAPHSSLLNVLLAFVVAGAQNDLPAAVLLRESDLLLLQRILALLQPGHPVVHSYLARCVHRLQVRQAATKSQREATPKPSEFSRGMAQLLANRQPGSRL